MTPEGTPRDNTCGNNLTGWCNLGSRGIDSGNRETFLDSPWTEDLRPRAGWMNYSGESKRVENEKHDHTYGAYDTVSP